MSLLLSHSFAIPQSLLLLNFRQILHDVVWVILLILDIGLFRRFYFLRLSSQFGLLQMLTRQLGGFTIDWLLYFIR